MSNPDVCEQAVRDCALFLDGARPGWEYEVDPATIDLTSNYRCVVGQIWGHVRRCPLWTTITRRYPRAIVSGEHFWRKEIRARRATSSGFPEQWTKPEPLVVG